MSPRMEWLLTALMIAATAVPAPAAAPRSGRDYRVTLDSVIKGKGYKFYVAVEPVKASAVMEFRIKPAGDQHEISLRSMHYTWKTSGMDIARDITPERVEDIDKGRAHVAWTPGMTRKGDTNPLEAFGKPIGFIAPGGREQGVVVRSPDKFVRFSENFRLGTAPLLHRPPLPEGVLKPGQTFTTDTRMPDPTYSGIQWTAPVQWTVDAVSGTGDGAVVQLSGASAATMERAQSHFGRMTDGTLSMTSRVKRKLENGDLVSAETRVSVRWKRDPGDNPGGVLEDSADAVIRETALESE